MPDPTAQIVLYGYRYSVYLRIVRMTLLEKGIGWTHVEIDPFAKIIPSDYLALHPFGRVPTLKHGDFVLYETAAITRYVDEAFAGPHLQPSGPQERARMNQVIAIADSYGYWPMVRQVFSPRVFNAALGTVPDESVIAEGIARSHTVLGALEKLASGSPFLAGDALTLADIHLAAMMAYFTAAEDGRTALSAYPGLSAWWAGMSGLQSLMETDPGQPS
ncbi:glutathione S-transferase family protein [Mesorhizobium sp. ZC-5]|uniref:glutathione S-transferase family protein n=1 Tax=Mesorhizobium sp. ZC-5 TaxID=2986066 RepID=UPI0021E86284|nr:glutathione S-transferase family protein [Mesorhizobium sp. ZC-5]MCV3238595.1 glutathione S-transferase family protein [Mesorhizobium sp. ZC-5]